MYLNRDTSLLQSRAPTVKGVMWVMAIVPLAFVLMRLYVRFYLRRVFGWDDGIAIGAMVRSLSVSGSLKCLVSLNNSKLGLLDCLRRGVPRRCEPGLRATSRDCAGASCQPYSGGASLQRRRKFGNHGMYSW